MSDYGQMVAATPSGRQWGAWLNRRTAYEFERDHYLMNGVTRAAARRRARQTIAALTPDPSRKVHLPQSRHSGQGRH
jgi:hypothetical protein